MVFKGPGHPKIDNKSSKIAKTKKVIKIVVEKENPKQMSTKKKMSSGGG